MTKENVLYIDYYVRELVHGECSTHNRSKEIGQCIGEVIRRRTDQTIIPKSTFLNYLDLMMCNDTRDFILRVWIIRHLRSDGKIQKVHLFLSSSELLTYSTGSSYISDGNLIRFPQIQTRTFSEFK